MPAKIGSTGTMDILVYMKSWLDAKCTGTQKNGNNYQWSFRGK